MEDDEKPREQLTSELRSLRQEVSELKSLAAGYRQAEKRLHRQHDRLEARLRINQAILQTQDLNEQLNLILDEVLALLKVESGSIHLVQGQNVELRCWRGISNQLVHHLSSLPVDSPVDCLQKRQVIHKRLSEQGVAHRLVKAEGIQAWASFPLFLPGPDKARSSQWLGTILVGSRRYRALSRADIQAFEAILDPLARLINHARDDHEAEMRLYRLFILREIDRAISTRRLISDILGVVVERVPRELGAEAVAISLPDEPERGLRFSRMRLPNGMVIPTEGCTLAKRLQRQFNEQQTPIIIADLAQNPDVQIDAQQTAPYKFVSYLGVPLVARGQTIGLLHVLTTRPRVFWEEDINFFSTLAGQVASAIDNTRLLNQAGEAEQRYRSIFDNAVNGIYQSTPSGQFMAINPALARMLAYESPEALITNLTDIKRQFYVNPKRRAEFVQLITEQGVVRGFEAQVYRRDGSLVWISENARAVRDAEGTLLYYEGFVEDITERKQLEERLEAIYQLGRELTLLHDETAIIRRMLETAANLLRVDITGYGRMEAETGELEYRFRLINGVMEPISLRLALDSEQGPAVTAARTGQTFNVPDLSREPAYVPLAGRSINRSELCVPMKVNQRVIGVLQAESAEPAHFTSADQQLLQNLADQAAAALENARLYTETQRRTRELAALNRASRVMASSLDLNIVLEQMLAEVKSLLEAEGASALLLDTPTSEELVFAAAASPGAEIMIGLRVPLTTSIAGWVARNGQPVLIDDTQHDRRFYAQVDAVTGMTTRSLLAVPLIRKETVIGVVEVINKAKGNFNRYDLDMLEALSGSAAIAIENARLYQAERARYQEAEALRRAALTLTSTIALDQVFAHILTELRHVAPYDSASVQLLKGDRLEIIDGYGFPDLSKVLGITLPATGNIANARVIETREPIIIDDVQESQLVFDIKPDTSAKIRNWMGVPLIIGERVIGMLTLDKYQANFYTPDHARIARAYAAQAAIALENARLHTEMEERAKQLAVLHELDRAITASLNIDDIYYAFAHHTARLVSYDCMSITLIKEDELQVAQAVDHRIDKNKEFEERWLTAGAVLPKKDSAAGWVIRQGQPLLRNSIPPNMRFVEDEELMASGIRSSMVIPLRIKREIIGTWNISSQQVGIYSPDDLDIAQSMADQLAIAIENARLYEAIQEQYRRLQESQAQLIQVEKMAALGRLMASIAHEINNPLQSVQGCLDLVEEELANQQRPDKLNYYLSIAANEIDRIVTIMRRMRDFYRMPGQIEPAQSVGLSVVDDFYRPDHEELQWVDLQAILEDVLQLANKQLQHSRITVERSWIDNLPLIQGSPNHLKQVFLNLVLNAIDAMAAQGGTLHLRTALDQIELNHEPPQPAVRLEFSDTGQGMPPEVLAHLFEPFFTTKEQGSGLGLATSFQIIESHHGKISATSQPGQGSAFTILLPVKQPK